MGQIFKKATIKPQVSPNPHLMYPMLEGENKTFKTYNGPHISCKGWSVGMKLTVRLHDLISFQQTFLCTFLSAGFFSELGPGNKELCI